MIDDTLPVLEAEKAKRNGSVQGRANADNGAIFDTPGISTFLFPIAQAADQVPAWSVFPYGRDRFLRAFYKTEAMLAGAVYSLTARMKALDFDVDGEAPRAKKYSHMVLQDCEGGGGLRRLLGKLTTDYLTTDNGCFMELIGGGRADKPLRGPLQPPYIMHMDSLLCWRTLDDEFPVIYINPLNGTYHKMHYTRVISASMHEQPDELARGVGFCGVSKILRAAQLMRDILIYRHEKVSGNFTRAVGFLENMNAQEFKAGLEATDEQAKAQGFARFKSIPFFGKASTKLAGTLLDLASIPDGFDLEKETTLYMYTLALTFGVDAREFWPGTASGATKADATIQHLKAQGKGIGDLIETLEGMIRQALPDTVEFAFDYTDDEQDRMRAEIHEKRTATILSIVSAGIMPPEAGAAHLIKEGIIDADLLVQVTSEMVAAQPVSDNTPNDEIDTQANTETLDKPEAPPPTVLKDPQQFAKGFEIVELKKKELQATRLDFESAFDNILTGARAGDYTRAQAQRLLYRLLQREGTQAYIDGLADGGVEIADSSELERDDLRTINGMLAQQSVYVSDFMAVVYSEGGLSDSAASGKAAQWFNGSIMPFYQAGLQASGANPMMEFAGDDGKESCPDCTRLKEQRHRLKDWMDRGFDPPNGINLDCHDGHNCHHQLVRVRGRERGDW